MSELTLWVKDNGQEIEVNDHPANVAQAEKMGWKKKGDKSKRAT